MQSDQSLSQMSLQSKSQYSGCAVQYRRPEKSLIMPLQGMKTLLFCHNNPCLVKLHTLTGIDNILLILLDTREILLNEVSWNFC